MHVPVLAAALALALLPSAARAQVEDPRAVVRAAELAVESDSVAAAAARWEARRRRDAGDRAGALGLATLARLTYDYPDAERRYRALAEALADRYAVHARLGLAYGLDARGLTAEMLAQLDSARALARLIGDGEGEGLVLVTRALAHANAFGVDAGLALLDSAERLLPAGTPDLHAELLRRRAIMLAVLQRPEAREVAARALVLARRSGSRLAEARALRAIGTELKLRNRDDSALVALRAAEALYRRTRTHDELALTLMFRVGSELQRGTLGEAKAALREAIASAEVAHDLFSLATARLATAAIATRVHDYTTATEQLERALVAFEQLSDSGSIAMVQHNLATVSLATGDPAGARARVHAALARHRRIGERGGEFEALRLLAMIAARERDWAGAERWLAEARGMLRRGEQLPEWRPALHYTESRLALARGHLDAAARLSRRFLASLDSAQHVARYDARMRLADVHAQRGEMARAEREAVEAADQLDRWRASLSDQQLRLRVFEASPWEDNDRDVSVARVLGALARAGRVEAAFALAERRRGRELLDQIARGAALRTSGDSAAPADAGVWRLGRPRTTEELRAALPDERTALLLYVAGPLGAPTTLFVLTRDDVRTVSAPPADSLAPIVARLRALVESGADPGPLARRLGAALLDSAVAALPAGVERLVVVPDGALHRVPFDALRLADDRFVVERFAVSLAPSASVAATLWREGARREGGARPVRLLALGDPAFAGEVAADGDEREVFRSAFEAAGGLPRLAASGREARLVARYAPSADVRLRDAASADFLKRASLEQYRVIHLATHALVDDRTIARTALALAPGGGEDGFLSAGDLAALRLAADIVVLSACRTAGGVVVGGEGIRGLTAPLLEAGARSVVATRWQIGDRGTVALVDDFYAGLARGLSAGDALRAAKLAAMRRGAPPSEWAAFTLVGDPSVRVPLVQPASPARAWITGACIALLAAAVVAARSAAGRRETGDGSA